MTRATLPVGALALAAVNIYFGNPTAAAIYFCFGMALWEWRTVNPNGRRK